MISLAAAFLPLGGAAVARITVIDQGQSIPASNAVTACTIGGTACSAITLPFSFDFGTGLTNQAFIYDRGIISFGAPILGTVDATADFTTFGVPVIAPLYVPGPTGTPGPYDAFTGTMTSPFSFPTTLPNFGTDLFYDPNAITSLSINLTTYFANNPGLSHLDVFDTTVRSVPEPATWAMMMIGFGAIGFSMRRRSKGRLQQLA
jgi:hypothetical protein